jgi:hypothetical protein
MSEIHHLGDNMCDRYAPYRKVVKLDSKWYNPFSWNRWLVSFYNGSDVAIIGVRAFSEESAALKARREYDELQHIN